MTDSSKSADAAEREVAVYREVDELDSQEIERLRHLAKETPMTTREALSWALLSLRKSARDPELERFVAPRREPAALRQQLAIDHLERLLGEEYRG